MKIVFYSVAGLLLLCGLNLDHFPPWTSFHAEAPAFLASALLLGAAAIHKPRIPAAVWLLLALALSAWLQWMLGHVIYLGDAVVASIYLLTFAIAWLWGYAVTRRGEGEPILLALCGVLVAMGLVASFQVLAQWLEVAAYWPDWVFDSGSDRRGRGNFGQANQTATLLLMAVASTGLLWTRRRIGPLSAYLLLFLLGLAIVLTQSRAGLLSATILALGVLILAWTRRVPWQRGRDASVWLIGLYAASWSLQYWDGLFGRAGIGLHNMMDAGLRPLMWRQLFAALMDSPWFGYGWLQIATAQQAGALHVPGVEQINYSHNAIVDLYVVLGTPLASLVLGLCCYGVIRRIRSWQGGALPALGGLFVVIPFLVHAQLELPHAYAYFLLPVGIILGILDGSTEPAQPRGIALTDPWLGRGLVVLWLGLLSAVAHEYMLAEEDFRINRFENRRLGVTPDDYHPPEFTLLTQLEDMLKAMRLRAQPGMSAQDLDTLVRAARRYTWAPLEFRTALALALNDRPGDAERHLQILKTMFRRDIYDESRESWLLMQHGQYPQLAAVRLP